MENIASVDAVAIIKTTPVAPTLMEEVLPTVCLVTAPAAAPTPTEEAIVAPVAPLVCPQSPAKAEAPKGELLNSILEPARPTAYARIHHSEPSDDAPSRGKPQQRIPISTDGLCLAWPTAHTIVRTNGKGLVKLALKRHSDGHNQGGLSAAVLDNPGGANSHGGGGVDGLSQCRRGLRTACGFDVSNQIDRTYWPIDYADNETTREHTTDYSVVPSRHRREGDWDDHWRLDRFQCPNCACNYLRREW